MCFNVKRWARFLNFLNSIYLFHNLTAHTRPTPNLAAYCSYCFPVCIQLQYIPSNTEDVSTTVSLQLHMDERVCVAFVSQIKRLPRL